jgi:hypothetical protein
MAGAGFFLLLQIPQDMQEKGMDISSTRLLEDLRETQQAAIACNVWYRVKFYPHTNEYKLFKQGDFIRAVNLQKGVYFGNSPPELTFLPTGAPTKGMTVILKTGSLERKVIIAPVMGRIRLEIVR